MDEPTTYLVGLLKDVPAKANLQIEEELNAGAALQTIMNVVYEVGHSLCSSKFKYCNPIQS